MTSKLIVNSVRHTGASADGITLASDGSVTLPGNATCSGTASGFAEDNWVKLATTTVSSNVSTVEFTNSITGAFDTYKIYALSITQYVGAVDNHEIFARIRDSSGSYTSSNYQTRRMTDQGNYNNDNLAHFPVTYNGIGNDTYEDAHSLIYMYNFEANRYFKFRYQTTFTDAAGSFRFQNGAGGARVNTETTGITLYSPGGDISNGIFTLYGIKT